MLIPAKARQKQSKAVKITTEIAEQPKTKSVVGEQQQQRVAPAPLKLQITIIKNTD